MLEVKRTGMRRAGGSIRIVFESPDEAVERVIYLLELAGDMTQSARRKDHLLDCADAILDVLPSSPRVHRLRAAVDKVSRSRWP